MPEYDTAKKCLANPCQYCGKREGEPITLAHTFYGSLCPSCVSQCMADHAAIKHLRELLGDAVRSWLNTWATNPVYRADRNELIAMLLDSNDFDAIAMRVLGEYRIKPRVGRTGAER